MEHNENIRLKVWGQYASFTRADLKVERFSYPCMTPSAARGILSCILWKPEFKWQIKKIEILKPIVYMNVKRNEIKTRQSTNPIIVEDSRTQRNSIILHNVAYIIEASIYQEKMDSKNPPKKYYEMFMRRVRKGQCFRRPYLGQREYSLEFDLPTENDEPIKDTVPIGSMFFDMIYDENAVATPLYFYDVAIQNGVLVCPDECNEKLMRSVDCCPYYDENDEGLKIRRAYFYEQGIDEEKIIANEMDL